MGDVLGNVFAHGAAVAISPVPLAVLVIVLSTPGARMKSLVFLLGWIAGLLVVGVLVITSGLFSAPDNVGGSGAARNEVLHGGLKIAFGVVLLAIGLRLWRRARRHEAVPLPEWMNNIDDVGALKIGGVAALQAAVNPKNFAINFATASSLAASGSSGTRTVIYYGAFVIVAASLVGLIVVAFQLYGHKADERLRSLRDWLLENRTIVVMLLCIVFGIKLAGTGIGILTGLD